MFESVSTSLRLTGASFRLVFRNPVVLLLPLLTLVTVAALIVAPIQFLVWQAENNPAQFQAFMEWLWAVPLGMWNDGNQEAAVWAFITEGYILWGVWMTFALTATLFFTTVGMDVATQQIRTRQVDFGAAFRLAGRNLHRIFLLAMFNAFVLALVHRLTFVLGRIPLLGRFIRGAVRLVLTAVTYLMLPIIIYERAGAVGAFKSAWRNVRKTWSGLLVGTGLAFGATWFLFNMFAQSILRGMMGADEWVSVSIVLVSGAILFALASSTAAAMRAVLYWYATTGEVPEGFDGNDLPRLAAHGPLATVAAAGLVAVPTQAQAQPDEDGFQVATRVLVCPKCSATVAVQAGQKPVCAACGHGKPAPRARKPKA
ncbi:MAG: hypothetical protein QOD77_1577 [Thermoplasmata archaeon]|jgi:hypothetical protein|nr:hypothetical protein [Thermoplasmata archaeon]